jgi:hypothetical protein
MYSEIEKTWEKKVVASHKVLSQESTRETEENSEKPQSVYPVLRTTSGTALPLM